MINYDKYENATPKELVYALGMVEKKAEKLANQVRENKELFKFLQNKLKKSFSIKKTKSKKIPALDEAIKEYKNGECETYANFDEYKKAMNAL